MGKIGCVCVVEPIVIIKPAVPSADGDELAGARMGDSTGFLAVTIEDTFDSVEIFEELLDRGDVVPVLHVDVSDLMIADRESP